MTYSRDPQAKAAECGDDVRVGVYVCRSTDDEHQPYSIEAQDARLAAYIGSQPAGGRPPGLPTTPLAPPPPGPACTAPSRQRGPGSSTCCWSTGWTGPPAASAIS
jgi:hypothetical protein